MSDFETASSFANLADRALGSMKFGGCSHKYACKFYRSKHFLGTQETDSERLVCMSYFVASGCFASPADGALGSKNFGGCSQKYACKFRRSKHFLGTSKTDPELLFCMPYFVISGCFANPTDGPLGCLGARKSEGAHKNMHANFIAPITS